MKLGSNRTAPKYPFLSRARQYLPKSAWSHCNTAAGPGGPGLHPCIPRGRFCEQRHWSPSSELLINNWPCYIRLTWCAGVYGYESTYRQIAFSWMFEEYLYASQSSVKEKRYFVRKTKPLFHYCLCTEVRAHRRCTVRSRGWGWPYYSVCTHVLLRSWGEVDMTGKESSSLLKWRLQKWTDIDRAQLLRRALSLGCKVYTVNSVFYLLILI